MPFHVQIDGGARLAVGKVVGIGKNYSEHVKEMAGKLWSGASGDVAPPPEPVVFLKPSTSLVADGGKVVLPRGVGEVHHELELAVVVGETMRRVPAVRALAHVAGYAVALDMTARDLQAAAKRQGLPWDVAKGMDTFCPISRVAPAERVRDPQDVRLELRVNGEVRQQSSTRAMTLPVAALLAHASRCFTLEPGDVLLTGTPEGVGPVRAGDRLVASAAGVGSLAVDVVDDDA